MISQRSWDSLRHFRMSIWLSGNRRSCSSMRRCIDTINSITHRDNYIKIIVGRSIPLFAIITHMFQNGTCAIFIQFATRINIGIKSTFVYITSLTLTSSIILRHKSLVMAMVGETLNLYCLPIERKLYTTLWRLRFICSVSSAFPSLVMIGNIYSVSEVYLSAICCIALSHLIVTAGLLSDVWEM